MNDSLGPNLGMPDHSKAIATAEMVQEQMRLSSELLGIDGDAAMSQLAAAVIEMAEESEDLKEILAFFKKTQADTMKLAELSLRNVKVPPPESLVPCGMEWQI